MKCSGQKKDGYIILLNILYIKYGHVLQTQNKNNFFRQKNVGVYNYNFRLKILKYNFDILNSKTNTIRK